MNFDGFLGFAKEAASSASKKTSEVVSVSKLKVEVMKQKSELSNLYEKLGKAVYSMRKDNYENEDLLVSVCESIKEVKVKIDVLNKKIAKEKNSIVCPTCGSVNNDDNLYCVKCGTKIKEEFPVVID